MLHATLWWFEISILKRGVLFSFLSFFPFGFQFPVSFYPRPFHHFWWESRRKRAPNPKRKYLTVGCDHRYRVQIPEPVPSLHQHGAPTGGNQVFPVIVNNSASSGAYLLRSERENKHVKRCKACEDCRHILFVFVSTCMVSKNLNTPNWSSMADDAITWGGYRSSLISFL